MRAGIAARSRAGAGGLAVTGWATHSLGGNRRVWNIRTKVLAGPSAGLATGQQVRYVPAMVFDVKNAPIRNM